MNTADDECCICFAEFTADRPLNVLRCGHDDFCEACIKNTSVRECPICRRSTLISVHFCTLYKGYLLHCHPYERIRDVIARLQVEAGVRYNFRLLFEKKQLDPDATLRECGVLDGAKVLVNEKL